MSKPIFVVRVPDIFDKEYLDNIIDMLIEKFFDYHVLVIKSKVDDITFECYHVTDLDTKSFEELKEIVKNLNNGTS